MVKWSNLKHRYILIIILRVDFFLGFLSLRCSFVTVLSCGLAPLVKGIYFSIHNNNFVACYMNWGLGILRSDGNGIEETLRVRITWKNETWSFVFVFVFCCSYYPLGNSQQISSSSISSWSICSKVTTTWWVILTISFTIC